MRSFKLLSLALSFAMFSHALPQATRHTAPVERRTISTSFVTHAMEAYEIKDFLISDIVSNEHYERSNKTYFRNISCSRFQWHWRTYTHVKPSQLPGSEFQQQHPLF